MASPEPSVRRRKPESKDSSASETEQPLRRVQTLPSDSDDDDAKKKEQLPKKPKSKTKKSKASEDADEYDGWNIALDIARVISFLFLASCGLSYLVSNGETFFWGMKNPPKYLTKAYYKELIQGPVYLTPSELALYDGTNPDLPIYLAINWTIYDVSANARTYGPGGSYHYFSGCDAARAYVTGCFAEDRSPDMRGVEEMYLPLDDPNVDKHWSRQELRELKKKEKEDALKKVNDGLKHWVDFFAKSDKYRKVGYVKMPKGWPGTEPMRPLCETAAKGRKVRKIPGAKEE
ncbi:hypothetical protein QBC40DRAFT_207891 [Triangularia verruculosa]|uniref:Cytochrome b5 heme-binding domain-containing protein n=1 Tax=Triangularia verruculosa TaxID=2587418 RepID=A0AAN6XBL8_9PEZI|nr:hypothetical protein QBC40DRAFT_207891 [Triangularia verruculosa]